MANSTPAAKLPEPVASFIKKTLADESGVTFSLKASDADKPVAGRVRSRGRLKLLGGKEKVSLALATLDGKRGGQVENGVEHRIQLFVDEGLVRFVMTSPA